MPNVEWLISANRFVSMTSQEKVRIAAHKRAPELECPMINLPISIGGYDGGLDNYYWTIPDPCGRDR